VKHYRIGELSTLYGVSVDILRHYEKLGLLEPEFTRENGYRYYSNRQIWKLNIIRTLRRLDLSLSDIRSYLTDRSLEKSSRMIEVQLKAIGEKQRELKKMKKELQERRKHLLSARSVPDDMEIRIKELPERRCWGINEEVVSFWDVDRLHKEIEVKIYGTGTRYTGFGKAGTRLSIQNFTNGEFGCYEQSFILDDKGEEILPEGPHVCLDFWGHDDMEGIIHHYNRVLVYMKDHGLIMSGSAIEIYRIDIHETDNPGEFLTELQVPVRPG